MERESGTRSNQGKSGRFENNLLPEDILSKIVITWKKSAIGYPSVQSRVITALGLKRLNHQVEHEDTPNILGMVHKVRHLVEVKQVDR